MKKVFAIFIVLLVAVYVSAQIRGTNITVKVTPDHKDWTYKVGENIKSIIRDGTGYVS